MASMAGGAAAATVSVRPFMAAKSAASVSIPSLVRKSSDVCFLGAGGAFPGHRRCPPAGTLQVMAKKKLEGRVVHTRMKNTVKVEVVRWEFHPVYKRIWKRKTFYLAHDEEFKFREGDMVELRKCQPISKRKHHIALPVPPRGGGSSPRSPPPPPSESFQEQQLDLSFESATPS